MTGGTIAAIVISQQILGQPCPWKKVHMLVTNTMLRCHQLLSLQSVCSAHVVHTLLWCVWLRRDSAVALSPQLYDPNRVPASLPGLLQMAEEAQTTIQSYGDILLPKLPQDLDSVEPGTGAVLQVLTAAASQQHGRNHCWLGETSC